MDAASFGPLVVSGATLEPLVAAAAARALRMRPDAVGPDVPFARLGLDSLGCLELAGELELALGIAVPPDAVSEQSTVRSLCATLGGSSGGDAVDRMGADAVLAAEIQPRAPRGPRSLIEARHVLLTGATGFLGSAILDVLLERSSAHVTCLVREGGVFGVRSVSAGRPRVTVVRGDLARPAAGLDADAWQSLAGDVDAIVHAGASINWIAGYDALRDVNVLATRELLRLACEAGASFHFVSSVSVCYSTAGPRAVDERHDALDTIGGLHFGYAQSKAVAEALVRDAGRRGLRTRIHRPALISGDSRTGRFNRDDMLSRMIAGCVRMGTAPDLDWRLDALPVDAVANAIVALSSGSDQDASHLVHPRPRHWRECVLWMRLYGYDVTLVPYRDWTDRLRDATSDADHPLRPLRSFFLDEAADGLTIPELHEQDRAPALDARRTSAAIAEAGVDIPALDAGLMDRYFAAFESSMLPAPKRRRARRGGGIDTAALGAVPFAADHSIISELTAWQSGGACGLFRVPGPDGRPLVLKIPARAADVHAVGEALAGICGERLGVAYREFGARLGTAEGAAREIALYRDGDPVLRAHTPRVVSTHADPDAESWSVILEDLRGAFLLDAVDRSDPWTTGHVETAVDGIAAIHGAWHSRVDELQRRPWMAPARTTATMIEMTPLWLALANHAGPLFARAAGPSLPGMQLALIERMAEWRPLLDDAPQTLIHNDFNPRNVCLRRVEAGADRRPAPRTERPASKRRPDPGSGAGSDKPRLRLCAFDWELASIGTPVRDLAEFLCFVSPADVDRPSVDRLIDRHATRFAAAAGVTVNRDAWHAAFGAALAEILVDRLSIYAMVHRVRPQAFLPRVLRAWAALHSLFPLR